MEIYYKERVCAVTLKNNAMTVYALVFKDLKSRFATLRNRRTGIPPMVGSDKDITEKEGISAVKAGDTLKATHSIYF